MAFDCLARFITRILQPRRALIDLRQPVEANSPPSESREIPLSLELPSVTPWIHRSLRGVNPSPFALGEIPFSPRTPHLCFILQDRSLRQASRNKSVSACTRSLLFLILVVSGPGVKEGREKLEATFLPKGRSWPRACPTPYLPCAVPHDVTGDRREGIDPQ